VNSWKLSAFIKEIGRMGGAQSATSIASIWFDLSEKSRG
jgi:hypothetical protein